MILRWTDAKYGQHYLDGIQKVTVLGTWARDDDEVPNYGEARVYYGLTSADEPYNEPNPVDCYLRLTDGTGHNDLHQIECIWMAILNDRGDTVDQIVRMVHR